LFIFPLGSVLITRLIEFFVFAEKLLVVLRDGRTLIGYLRSIDQFGKACFMMVPFCCSKHFQDTLIKVNSVGNEFVMHL